MRQSRSVPLPPSKADSRNHGVILFDAAQKSGILSVGVSPHFLSFRSPNLASGNCCIVCELLAPARSAVEGANNTCDRRRTNSWQALEKAVFRVIATIIGVALFAIMALFSQTRDLLLIAYAGWMGLCVYVAGLFDGNRAYAAVLSGFTVALVVIQQIDNPELVFEAGMMRGAGIPRGNCIPCNCERSHLWGAPNRHTGASGATCHNIRIGTRVSRNA